MKSPVFFPDFQHVDAIRRALWTSREFGRAAVLVGAGMSRNAIPLQLGRHSMPTWWDLVIALVDRLYPSGSGHDDKRADLLNQAGATSTALRLADEYVAAFGRASLDELIVENTPDLDYAPGNTHALMIDLPWSDILTTNYDTLLERAAEASNGPRYSVVRTVAELSASQRPRIVKLHGSLPSNRPFIFTEDDFRTFPSRFAPFVNLATQTALENVLCLIGFSGDDPNFLAWTGWVRDQLSNYAPRVYLCGLLNLTNSQRLLLESRGVIPVDLTPVFAHCPNIDRSTVHRRALEWFLLNLHEGRTYDPLSWPDPPPPMSIHDNLLPPLLPNTLTLPIKENALPPSDCVKEANVKSN